MKKNINLKIISVVLIIGIFSVSLIKQVVVLRRIKKEISTQTQELEQLKEKNIKLQAELDRAQGNNEYLEKLARERLGLIKEGEQQIITNNISETIKEAVGTTYSPSSLSIKSNLPSEAEKLLQSLKLFIGEPEE